MSHMEKCNEAKKPRTEREKNTWIVIPKMHKFCCWDNLLLALWSKCVFLAAVRILVCPILAFCFFV